MFNRKALCLDNKNLGSKLSYLRFYAVRSITEGDFVGKNLCRDMLPEILYYSSQLRLFFYLDNDTVGNLKTALLTDSLDALYHKTRKAFLFQL